MSLIVALHNNMSDAQTRRIIVSDGHVYLEGDCLEAPTLSMTKLQPCAATARSFLCVRSSVRYLFW